MVDQKIEKCLYLCSSLQNFQDDDLHLAMKGMDGEIKNAYMESVQLEMERTKRTKNLLYWLREKVELEKLI